LVSPVANEGAWPIFFFGHLTPTFLLSTQRLGAVGQPKIIMIARGRIQELSQPEGMTDFSIASMAKPVLSHNCPTEISL